MTELIPVLEAKFSRMFRGVGEVRGQGRQLPPPHSLLGEAKIKFCLPTFRGSFFYNNLIMEKKEILT